MSPYWRKQYGDGMGDTTIIWMDFTTYKNWMQSFVVLLAHERVEQHTFCWRAVALQEENVLLSMLLQLLAHESVEQRTFCWRAVALHEENVLLSMLLQLLAHESVEQHTFCWRAVALHEENVLLSMLLQPCKNTKNAFNTYDNIFTFIWNTVKIIIICINILHL